MRTTLGPFRFGPPLLMGLALIVGMFWLLHALITHSGVGAGKRVGVLLRNRAELVPTLLSLLWSERCIASVNASAPDDKLAEDLCRAAVPAVIATTADWAREGLRDAAEASGAGSRLQMCRRPCTVRRTSPARSSTTRCFDTAGSDMAYGRARSVTHRSPCARCSRMRRRVGSARAL